MTLNMSKYYAAGVVLVIAIALLVVWSTIVRDDGTGIGYFMIILAIFVGWTAAAFEPDGMKRTLYGTAIMQVLLGIAIATAPESATAPGGPPRVLVTNVIIAVLWLTAALLFRQATKAVGAASSSQGSEAVDQGN